MEIYRHIPKLRKTIDGIQPDIVHAMRLPYEAVAAVLAACPELKLVASVWGNDFTLHAHQSLPLTFLTKVCLQRIDALHCDCYRDVKLAKLYGFDSRKRQLVVPTAGGVQRNIFHPASNRVELTKSLKLGSLSAQYVINPRGFRGYIRNDTFFRSVPKVLARVPKTVFVCPSMYGNKVAESWVAQLNITESVRLLPSMSREQMAKLFQVSDVMISASTHDGTPNTLLEALACGCYPVVSNIETMHEWITDGVNGSFFEADDSDSLAEEMIRALTENQSRDTAFQANQDVIECRANYDKVMSTVEQFYSDLLPLP